MANKENNNSSLIIITGAAGFIGSHLVDRLLLDGYDVLGVDDLSLGKMNYLKDAGKSKHFQFVETDVSCSNGWEKVKQLLDPNRQPSCIWHLAANSDVFAGVGNPSIDLERTFLTTFATLNVMKEIGCQNIVFASTSAVYGERQEMLHEDSGPLLPISNYGAMKLASEAMISAATSTVVDHAWIFRFPNVVGSRATHGICFDLICKLRNNPDQLEVLGDGTQQKPYLHVSELIDAMCFAVKSSKKKMNLYNIGPDDKGSSVDFIARSVVKEVSAGAKINFTGGDRGWVGDVPRFTYDTSRIKRLGWLPSLTSNQAIMKTISELKKQIT